VAIRFGAVTIRAIMKVSPVNAIRLAAMTIAMFTTAASAADTADPNLAAVRKILREVPRIDGHNDTPWQYRNRHATFDEVDLASDTLPAPQARHASGLITR
jgi:hypothetical protein